MMSEKSFTTFPSQPALALFAEASRTADAFQGPYAPMSPLGMTEESVLLPFRLDDQTAYGVAERYLASIIPGIRVRPLSNVGTTAVVMRDETTAFKIMRGQKTDYRDIENEAAALAVLGAAGIAPKLHLLIDAAQRYRVARSFLNVSPLFEDSVQVPRIESAGKLAVLATELKEDVGGIDELPVARLGAEFNKFARAALELGILYEDCPFHYDRISNSAVVIDVGQVCVPRFKDGGIALVHDTFNRFIPNSADKPSYVRIADILIRGGSLDDLHPLLHEYRERAGQ